MATVLQNNTALSDSVYKRRPPTFAYFRSNVNTSKNNVEEIHAARLRREMKFPTLHGRQIYDSFDIQNSKNEAFIEFYDEGEGKADAPKRSYDSAIDPTSGFMSAGGDVEWNTKHNDIHTMVSHPITPQSTTPQSQNSIRPYQSAPPHLRRHTENDPGSPCSWNSKQVSDAHTRSALGGWTSERDARMVQLDDWKSDYDENRVMREKLALKFLYTSSTQRAYEEVEWDRILRAPVRWPPVTTLEPKADRIRHNFTHRMNEPHPKEYQTVGRSWDSVQNREGFYKKNIPIPGVNFCSPCPRAQQIPNYSGCIGTERNLEEIDNPDVPFIPMTVKRTVLPWPTDTAHTTNIPMYTGCTLYRPNTVPAHSNNAPAPGTPTSALVHRPMYVTPNDSLHKRESKMSKLVTTVPPCNPFNKINKEPVNMSDTPPEQKN